MNKRPPAPLDAARLDELALGYVARFATTRARLAAYLTRKLRERGWAAAPDAADDDAGQAAVATAVARLSAAGYVDDAVFARGKRDGLLRRGYGARRVDQALVAAGVAAELRTGLRPAAASVRGAALALARRRGLGPFGAVPPGADPAERRKRRERQVAAMLRAGHSLDSACKIIDAISIAAAEQWAAAEQQDDERCWDE